MRSMGLTQQTTGALARITSGNPSTSVSIENYISKRRVQCDNPIAVDEGQEQDQQQHHEQQVPRQAHACSIASEVNNHS